jgi:hypothetical protein
MDCYSCNVRQQSLSHQVRDYARRTYIDAARRRREALVQIVADDVQKALRLTNRSPVVRNARSSKRFLEENRIALEKCDGPPLGLSTTAKFTYRLLRDNGANGPADSQSLFLGLRGAAMQVFQALGGGEAFIRAERDSFDKPA